jgi:hypothetical protein
MSNFTLSFIWFCWLILRADKSSNLSSARLPPSVVKFPATRVPSRITQKKPVETVAKPSPVKPSQAQSIPSEFERYLRRSCAGNLDTVESLIQYEIKRSKGLFTRAEAAHAAYV